MKIWGFLSCNLVIIEHHLRPNDTLSREVKREHVQPISESIIINMNIIQEALQKEVLEVKRNLTPVEKICPFFEWDGFSDNIMKDMGFKITNLVMSITKEKWICISVDWKLEDEKDRGYMVKYPKFNGSKYSMGGGNDEVSVEFFFSEIESAPEAYRAEYTDIERTYNGFGKVSFEIGIQIDQDYYDQNENNDPRIGYEYGYSVNTKYGVMVYFKPNGFGLTDKVLFEYNADDENLS